MADWTPIVVAFITAAGGSLIGWAALRKSGAEAKKSSADASSTIVDSASEVVKILREQMVAQGLALSATNARVMQLEITVGTWEGWAEKVLDLLDRALAMLEEEQRAKIQADVAVVKKTRPAHGIPRSKDPPQAGT